MYFYRVLRCEMLSCMNIVGIYLSQILFLKGHLKNFTFYGLCFSFAEPKKSRFMSLIPYKLLLALTFIAKNKREYW